MLDFVYLGIVLKSREIYVVCFISNSNADIGFLEEHSKIPPLSPEDYIV